MRITKIDVFNFRNYQKESISFENGINMLVGKNGQGKTNLIEAIYFSCIGKSPKTNKEKELIMFGENKSRIFVVFDTISGEKTVEITLNNKSKKTIKINGVSLIKISELIGNFNCVFFSPSELKLIKDSPEDRRRFMNIDISQLDKKYFYSLNKYNNVIKQKNALLKTSTNLESLKKTSIIWDKQLAALGSQIISSRIKFINSLKLEASKYHKELSNKQEDLEIEYEGLVCENVKDTEKQLLKEYNKKLKKDMELGYTSVGPHRDDIKIKINKKDLKKYGSQGQQRTAALSLKLAELEIFKKEKEEYPILLLDDVFSELDNKRRQALLNILLRGQTIISATEFSGAHKTIEIEKGKIKKNNTCV